MCVYVYCCTGGHNCPFKQGVETPWMLRLIKLYTHQEGSADSVCYNQVWGDDSESSLRHSNEVQRFELYPSNESRNDNEDDVLMADAAITQRFYLK